MAPSKKNGPQPNPNPIRISPGTPKSVTTPLISSSQPPQSSPERTIIRNHISILDLPIEVLDQIFSYISQIDLLSCCLVSKRFHQHSTSHLWSHLKLSPSSKDCNAKGDATRLSIYRSTLDKLCYGKSRRVNDLAKSVKHLTLDYHDETWCRSMKGALRLPDLRVLQINLASGCSRTRYAFHQYSAGERCKLISDIHPSTIIIRDCVTSENPLYCPSIWPLSLWRNVHDLFFVSSDYQSTPKTDMDLGFPEMLLDRLKSITWIFSPINTSGRSPSDAISKYKACSLFPLIFTLKQTEQVPFTIVNPAHLGRAKGIHQRTVDYIKYQFVKSATELWYGKGRD
ncbi:uncharacterized protein L199_007476 [Kwoniella botswanensis]|uniref:uncharacterized protein n=1 Tax=Kwoniella botswanensis TaxID=1268659 RepID=UPI00315CD09C